MFELQWIQPITDLTEYKIKVIMIGESNSGKSCFLSQLIYAKFSLIKEHSIGIEIGSLKFKSKEFGCLVDVWDCASNHL